MVNGLARAPPVVRRRIRARGPGLLIRLIKLIKLIKAIVAGKAHGDPGSSLGRLSVVSRGSA